MNMNKQKTGKSGADERSENRPDSGRVRRKSFMVVLVVLFSISINLVLVGLIGFFNRGEESVPEPSSTWQIRSVRIPESRPKQESLPVQKKVKSPEVKKKTNKREILRQKRKRTQSEPRKINISTSDLSLDLDPASLVTGDLNHLLPGTSGSENDKGNGREGRGQSAKGSGEGGEVSRMPRKISGDPPEYPESARRKEVEGWVLLSLDISRDGRVRDVRVIDWKGSPQFPRSARLAVRNWLFEPARSNGEPVAVTNIRQKITFQLTN